MGPGEEKANEKNLESLSLELKKAKQDVKKLKEEQSAAKQAPKPTIAAKPVFQQKDSAGSEASEA